MITSLSRTFLLLLLLASTPLVAQQKKGDSELQLQGSLSFDFGSDGEDSGKVVLTYGRFFTDNQEWGLSVLGTIDSEGKLGGIGGPFWRINFGSEKTVPYLGVAAVTAFGGSDTDQDLLLQGEGGVRWFLNRNMAFTLGGLTRYDVDESEFSETLDILFGFSYFFGS